MCAAWCATSVIAVSRQTYNRGFALATGKYVLPARRTITSCRASSRRRWPSSPATREAGAVRRAFGSCTDGDDGPLVVNDPAGATGRRTSRRRKLCGECGDTLPVSAIIVRRDALAGGRRIPAGTGMVLGLVRVPRGRVPPRRRSTFPKRLAIHVLHRELVRQRTHDRRREHPHPRCVLDLLTVAGVRRCRRRYFRRNGAACHFGPDLIRAAALRQDRREPQMLGFLTGFAPEVYESVGDRPRTRRARTGHDRSSRTVARTDRVPGRPRSREPPARRRDSIDPPAGRRPGRSASSAGPRDYCAAGSARPSASPRGPVIE